jgi:hypothetical protein
MELSQAEFTSPIRLWPKSTSRDLPSAIYFQLFSNPSSPVPTTVYSQTAAFVSPPIYLTASILQSEAVKSTTNRGRDRSTLATKRSETRPEAL